MPVVLSKRHAKIRLPFLLAPEVEAHSSGRACLECASRDLVARTEDGDLVSRRGPFQEGNLKGWIVELPVG